MILVRLQISLEAALRVPLAVTWLTVYRQLHIPALVWSARLVSHNNLFLGTLFSMCALDCVGGFE